MPLPIVSRLHRMTAHSMLAGGLLGLMGGIMVGVIRYHGLLRIPVHRCSQ